eukprot:TRINITY_DN1392_c0_g1_i1.p1 TRINITY_DN1392_c0_g1~~TRINITY_DN1392_c0_g1_i1.p1  ORF type:complete len:763 (-),score=87.64 TRINITY_DN1392_c0_g1_i1:71-2359(-)
MIAIPTKLLILSTKSSQHTAKFSKPIFSSTLNKEEWFYGNLTGKETESLLMGQSPSTYLLRFSAQHRHCLATAYVGASGNIVHALINKTPRGYQHGEDRVFATTADLISAYQTVLTFPYIDTDNIVDKISREARRNLPAGAGPKPTTPSPSPGRPFKVFGESLVEVCQRSPKYPIPYVAEQCILYLNQHVGTPDLFRESASATEVTQLRESFDKGHDVDVFQCKNPHLIARLLKTYLHSLPDPLLSYQLYKTFMHIDVDSCRVPDLRRHLARLPKEHTTLLKYLLKLLIEAGKEEARKTNNMDLDQLAHVIGPHILRDINPTMSHHSYQDSKQIARVTKLLIENAEQLYPELEKLDLSYIKEDGIVLTANRRQVKAATKEKLVQTLFSPGGLNASCVTTYVPKFLLTYRSFMTSKELLDHLVRWFHEFDSHPNKSAKNKKLRICNFLKKWTEEQYYEFQANEELLNAYKSFVGTILEPSMLDFMLSSIERLNKTRHIIPTFPQPPPRAFWPRKSPVTNVTDLRALEIARQMTMIESEMFKKIRPQELCECAWTKDTKLEIAANVTRMAHRFNAVVYFIMTTILNCDQKTKRERILNKWINVGTRCRELNNYNGVMEIVAALNNGPIQRLVELKRKLNSPAAMELKELMSHTSSYKAYREALKHTNPPLLPYLGCFQTDLVYIDEGLKIKTKYDDVDYVHFYKCYRVAAVIQQVQQYQQTPYNFYVVPPIREWLLTIDENTMTDDECWESSFKTQPRKSKKKS